MTAVTAGTVRLAAALLPRSMRDRYREQWLADLADADEAGVSRAEIAVGSLAFAATYDRPLRVRVVDANRRARLASGLALAAALVSVSAYGISAGYSLSGFAVFDYAVFVTSALLFLFTAIAPIAAIALVSVTRGIAARIRVAVWLLALATLAPVARASIDSAFTVDGSIYLTVGNLAYLAGAAIVVSAIVLLARGGVPRERRERAAAGVGAIVVFLIAAGGFVWFGMLWLGREPLSVDFLASPYATAEWLAGEAEAERRLVATWIAVGVGVLVVCLALASTGWSRKLPAGATRWLSVGVGFIVLIVFASFLAYSELMLSMFGSYEVVAVLFMVGRWGIALTVLFAVGVLRFARKAPIALVQVEQ